MSNTMPTIETVLERIQDFRSAVEARFDRVETRLDRVEARLDRLENGQTEIRKDIKSLSRQIDLIHQDIYKLRKIDSDLNERIEQLEGNPNAPTTQLR